MGFRDIRNFNQVMLTKQGWQLQMRIPTIALKLLKARYFPYGSFLDASMGSNPSYLWRSIRESQSLINQVSLQLLVDRLVWQHSRDGNYMAALNRRNITVDAYCPMCNADLEADFHILCECSFAKVVCLASKWGIRDIDHRFSSPKEWFLMLLQKLDRITVEEVCCVMRAIWKGRNSLVFKKESMNLLQVIQLGLGMCFQFATVYMTERPHQENIDLQIVDVSDPVVPNSTVMLIFFNVMGKHLQVQALSCEILMSKVFAGDMEHIVEDCCMVLNLLHSPTVSHCKRDATYVAHELAHSVKTTRSIPFGDKVIIYQKWPNMHYNGTV
ncbi:Uncharacterized protein TCM_014186 [Theobroma cacao]|uniref:Reverse transcriptase zinc-binding domain-containing protein n=1 Tax=Theobroma cacao TaxID=3641 RepID=A0A061FYQ6_THECC|nr:Uncharacterized protein TCM_014186 [Theobroma cacao]